MELIAKVAEDTDLSRSKAKEVVVALLAAIEAALQRTEGVRLSGFGTFVTTTRKATKGRHPRTGATIDVPASVSVRFKAAKSLKDRVGSSS